jgi:hypothetical protein
MASVVKSVAGLLVSAALFPIFAIGTVILGSVAYSSYMMSKLKKPGSASDSSTRLQTVRSAVQPHRVIYGTVKTGGVLVYAQSHGTDNKYITLVVCFAAHQVDAILEVYLNDKLSTDAAFTVHHDATPAEGYDAGGGEGESVWVETKAAVSAYDTSYVTVTKYLGTATQTADPTLVALPDGLWTANHVLTNRAYVVVTLEDNQTAFPNGLPNITALIRGNNQIYDPATLTTGYSNNWALCLRDYLTKPYGLNAPASDINETVAIAARNICDELVTLADATTEKRYVLNGSFTVDNTPISIMNEIMAAAYGAITWTQGQYRILPAAYYAPDMTFHGMNAAIPGLTESDLRGPLKVRPAASMKDKFNVVKGTYISPTTWQEVDFPPVKNALYLSEDGYEITKDVQLSYVTSPAMAQRISKIILEKSRQGISVDFPAKWSAFPLAVGDTVPITVAQLGWSQKIFTVRDWKMSPDGGIDLQLQEDAAGCYAWNNGEETTVDLAPNTVLADPRYSPTPTGVTVGEELYSTNVASIIMSRAIVTWVGIGAAQYEVNYLPPNNTIWAPLPFIKNTVCTVDDVTPGGYSFRVRGMNYLGVWSAWATVTHIIAGKSAPPPDADTFLIAPQQDGTRQFSWSLASPPLDMAGYRIKFNTGSTPVTWASMTELHSGLLLASPFESNQLPSGDYIFAIKAVDTTGNESLNAKYITTTLPNQRLANVWAMAESMAGNWPGVRTSCVDDGQGGLEATDLTTWDTLPATWDLFTRWNMSPMSPISYQTTVLDMGGVRSFQPQLICYGTGTITQEMSTSNDDIAWTSWGAIINGTFRYVRFLITVSAASPIISTLQVVSAYLLVKPIVEEIEDLNTLALAGPYRLAVGDIRLPISNHYEAIKQVSVTLQNTGGGWSWELIDKDIATGPRIKIYNAAQTLSDATVDAYIKGI